MAKHQQRPFASDFTFTPDVDDLVATNPDGTIDVVVTDTGGNTAYTAAIADRGGVFPAPTNLPQQGSTNIFRGPVPAGVVPNAPPQPLHPNKTVKVQAWQGTVQGNSDSHDVRIWSGGSGSGILLGGASLHCHNCGTHHPVPVALQLRLDARVTAGLWAGCEHLNEPIRLLHSNEHVHKCCWFSPPIAPPGGGSAFWQLQKDDPHTWVLVLRHGHANLITYRHRTVIAKDCSFPIALHLASAERGDHENWPRTVTIAPAP